MGTFNSQLAFDAKPPAGYKTSSDKYPGGTPLEELTGEQWNMLVQAEQEGRLVVCKTHEELCRAAFDMVQ